MIPESEATEAEKIERSRMIPESEATEAEKNRKVTHDFGKRSDRSAKKSKGHA